MANGANISITGVKEIDDVFKGLPLQFQDKVLQSANLKSAKPLVEKAKLLAPEGPSGFLVDSIGAIRGSFNQVRSLQREVGQVVVGPRRGGRYKGWHAHLVEYGTRSRVTKGRGRKRKYRNASRGTMPKKPFMEPAFNQTKSQMLARFKEDRARALQTFMKRTLRNAA